MESVDLVHRRVGKHIFEGITYGDTLRGKWPGDLDQCFSMRMDQHCLRSEGTIHPCKTDNSSTFTKVQKLQVTRRVGMQCTPQSGRACMNYPHAGIQACLFGYWSTTCQFSKCASDSCLLYDESLGMYTCQTCDDGAKGRCPDSKPFYCPPQNKCMQKESACTNSSASSHLQRGSCPLSKPFYCHGKCHRFAETCYDMVYKGEMDKLVNKSIGWCPQYGMNICSNSGKCRSHLSDCKGHHTSGQVTSCPPDMMFCARTGLCVSSLHECYRWYSEHRLQDELSEAQLIHCPQPGYIRCDHKAACCAAVLQVPAKKVVPPSTQKPARHTYAAGITGPGPIASSKAQPSSDHAEAGLTGAHASYSIASLTLILVVVLGCVIGIVMVVAVYSWSHVAKKYSAKVSADVDHDYSKPYSSSEEPNVTQSLIDTAADIDDSLDSPEMLSNSRRFGSSRGC